MQKKCDLCGAREGTLSDRITVNNQTLEYTFCEVCYKTILKSGLSPHQVMAEKLAKLGKECPVCGWTAENFRDTFLMGCPECYEHMRGIALDAALRSQGADVHTGKSPSQVAESLAFDQKGDRK